MQRLKRSGMVFGPTLAEEFRQPFARLMFQAQNDFPEQTIVRPQAKTLLEGEGFIPARPAASLDHCEGSD